MSAVQRFKLVPLVLLAIPAAQPGLAAQEPSYPPGFDEPMQLYGEDVLGSVSRPVTTSSAEAQAYVDQAFAFMYAFTKTDGARAFRKAQQLDSLCAMCYWGEAWAWGPYLNSGMQAEDAPRAYAAAGKAMELRDRTSPVERALIEAMALRYRESHDVTERKSLDSAYAQAMQQVYARYPDDLDVATLYGEALMLLEPRRGSWSLNKPAVRLIHQVLEEALARDITHPGACHLYIHATESTARPDKAEACAAYLGNAIPGASHINHMPSHTYNRVGRWGEAVRANLQAWHTDQRAAIGKGFAIYPSHNLHMLLFAASMDGQGAIAIQAGRDYAKLRDGGVFYHGLTLIRFGRFDEVLELTDEPEHPVYRGLWAFARGYAQLRLGQSNSATAYLALVDSLAIGTPDSVTFRGHTAKQLLGVTGGILRAELARADGRLTEAVVILEQATALEDELRYDEPEPLNFSARHWLGPVLLEAGRPAEAERVYRAELEDHPNNGWSLFGLLQSLRAQGKTEEIPDIELALAHAWARADVWLSASRF